MIDALFGSKTRVKLLHLFLNNPDRAFYVREITRKIDEQINSVRRELANMLSIGIIKSDNIDNKLYYEVNKKYTYYAPLKQIFSDGKLESEAAAALEANDWAARLKPLGDVRVAILSGSFVKNSTSPVDILLVGSLNKNQVKKFIHELEQEEGRVLNFTVMSYEDFYYRMSVKDKFINEILSGKSTIVLDSDSVLTEKQK
ncbi:MAG TPA: transcriptional regulator [Verrucomicrobiae bacterium]|nr:transcriptional regulator [Verrucomicrobiae bacterium]